MSTSIINFNDKKVLKGDFYKKNKKIFNISDIDINKILVTKKEQYGKHNSFKYFIGFDDNGHCICLLYKRLATLINLIKTK